MNLQLSYNLTTFSQVFLNIIIVAMLQIPHDKRLAYIRAVIEDQKLEFPVAEIERRTRYDAGNISNVLKGKLKISNNFFTSFLKAFPEPPVGWDEEEKVTLSEIKEILLRIESTIAQGPSRIRVVKTVSNKAKVNSGGPSKSTVGVASSTDGGIGLPDTDEDQPLDYTPKENSKPKDKQGKSVSVRKKHKAK